MRIELEGLTFAVQYTVYKLTVTLLDVNGNHTHRHLDMMRNTDTVQGQAAEAARRMADSLGRATTHLVPVQVRKEPYRGA